jgi:hypothetical protein
VFLEQDFVVRGAAIVSRNLGVELVDAEIDQHHLSLQLSIRLRERQRCQTEGSFVPFRAAAGVKDDGQGVYLVAKFAG